MKLASALVVDEIRDQDDGTVDLLGLREDLYFDELPVILERLTLFIELEIEPDDLGQRHRVELRVVDSDGKQIIETAVRFTLPLDYARATAPLDPTIFEVPFHQFGRHYVEIGLDGTLARRVPLAILPRDDA